MKAYAKTDIGIKIYITSRNKVNFFIVYHSFRLHYYSGYLTLFHEN